LAAFQLLFGKCYTFFNIKLVFLSAIAVFEIGSLICAVAHSSTALIVGRAIAGTGAAGLFTGSLVIIAYTVPLAKRPIFTGLLGAMYGTSSVAAPLVGGVLTDKVSWRWCFYINLPIGGVSVAVIVLFFRSPQRQDVASLGWKERLKQFDILGTIFFIPAIISLLLGLQWAGLTMPWSDARIIALFVIFGVCMIIFLGIQFWKPDIATISPHLMSKRSVWAAGCFTFFQGAAFFLVLYYLPIWFQAVKGVSAFESGVRNIPLVFSCVIASIGSGVLVTTLGHYAPFMIASSVFMAIGIGLLTTFEPSTNRSMWIGYQAISGFGVGLGMQQPLIAVQTVLEISQVPIATAILVFLQSFGGAVFVSVGQSIFTNTLVSGVAKLGPGLDPVMVATTGATNIQVSVPPQFLSGVTLAYNNGLTEAWTVALVMACMTIIGSLAIEWRSVKGKKAEVAAGSNVINGP
jgi:MFS family permease